jgi:CheY-specific phosphatase CheX
LGNLEKELQPLLERAHTISADRLKIHARGLGCDVSNASFEDIAKLPMTSQIIVAGEEMELVYRIHFTMADAKKLTANRLGAGTTTQPLVLDFFRELCNVVSGNIKTILDGVGIQLAQGLPFVVKGHVERPAQPSPANVSRLTSIWGHKVDAVGGVKCSILIDIKNPAVMAKIAKIADTTTAAPPTGIVELF